MAFNATARIPCRPLSAEHKDLAEPKELLIDYNTGVVTVCKADGTFIDMGESIKTIIMENIKTDPDMVKEIIIQIDGEDYSLETIILQHAKEIEDLKNALGFIKDEAGNIKFDIIEQIQNIFKTDSEGNVIIEANNIKDTDTKVMMTVEEREKLASMSSPQTTQVTVGTSWTGTEAPYTQTVSVPGVKDTDIPIVDIVLSATYSTAMEQLDSYAYLYKIVTANNQIVIYATEKTKVGITLQMKFDRNITTTEDSEHV